MARLGPKDRDGHRIFGSNKTRTARLDKNQARKNFLEARPDSKMATLVIMLFRHLKIYTKTLKILQENPLSSYDLQFQLPTASDKDPLVPTFVGSAKLEFQLTRQLPPFESQQQYLNNNEIIKLTFLSQKLDQFENITLIRFGEDEEISFNGIITYNKGLFYRDAGGLPLLGSNFFFEFSPSLFPQLGGPLQKTTTKTLIQTQPPLFIWTNRLLHTSILKRELAKISGPVFEAISSLLGKERLPLNALNLLIIDDFNSTDSTHSFGLISISLIQWEASDQAHKIALLARQFARQWLGGMTTVANTGIFCLQEDIVEWLTHKIKTHCSLKGVQFFTSIERLINSKGELTMLGIIQRLLVQQRYRHFRLEHLDELLRPLLVDSIDIGQVFTFWFKSGGIPNLLVEKSSNKNNNNRLRLVQLNNGRQSQQLLNGVQHWSKMPLWPIPIDVQNVTLPFKFMLSQVLELAPLDRKLLPLTNLGFG
uniref:Peptidase_M1 domain-containing protein n=1 Tax=Meloidogyne hapla TaxID=6305 RepID=A0A1I8B8W3_MELHA